uniref:Uncharacterized protein n=1 Tax=Candidatus Kentrum sp. MB TaxID=2138164 RepID=A0A450X7D8_9GAMM|nr:MAG: hypothetical protein BECKMB1821G_GA0114241_101151 [Candidatus Kentron sp. MB]
MFLLDPFIPADRLGVVMDSDGAHGRMRRPRALWRVTDQVRYGFAILENDKNLFVLFYFGQSGRVRIGIRFTDAEYFYGNPKPILLRGFLAFDGDGTHRKSDKACTFWPQRLEDVFLYSGSPD